MFARSKSNRNKEIDLFFQFEEMKRQEILMVRSLEEDAKELKRASHRMLSFKLDQREQSREQDSEQNDSFKSRNSDQTTTGSCKTRNSEQTDSFKSRHSDSGKQTTTIEVKEFLEQRAQQRRAYQAKKLLAEFLEQRAHARREYREAKARGELSPSPNQSGQHGHGLQPAALDALEPAQIIMAEEIRPHSGLRGMEIESGITTQPALRRRG